MGLLRKLFGKKQKKPPETLIVPHVEFVGEQNGEPEREFKSAIHRVLAANEDVVRAYLARVVYDAGVIHVALCLRSQGETAGVRKHVFDIFTGTFRTEEHLDIIVISRQQERLLASVCRPFFARAEFTGDDASPA